MKKFLSICMIVWCSAAAAQLKPEAQHVQKTIESIIADQAIENAVIGICAISGDGQTLAEINSHTMMVPASNMKLISSGAAIHRLGADYKFETSVGYDGTIENGVLKGNIYIIGGGGGNPLQHSCLKNPVDRGAW